MLMTDKPEYSLTKRIVQRKFWFNKVEYWIDKDMGPFNNKDYCYQLACDHEFYLKDCTGE